MTDLRNKAIWVVIAAIIGMMLPMADLALGNIQVAANGEIQLAQAVEVVYYYGYCFDAGLDEYCYWFPAADVIVTDTWVEYTPL
jgi:hypothetical protein